MNVIEEIYEIRSCIEILANDYKVDTTVCSTVNRELITRYTVYILGALHPLGGMSV